MSETKIKTSPESKAGTKECRDMKKSGYDDYGKYVKSKVRKSECKLPITNPILARGAVFLNPENVKYIDQKCFGDVNFMLVFCGGAILKNSSNDADLKKVFQNIKYAQEPVKSDLKFYCDIASTIGMRCASDEVVYDFVKNMDEDIMLDFSSALLTSGSGKEYTMGCVKFSSTLLEMCLKGNVPENMTKVSQDMVFLANLVVASATSSGDAIGFAQENDIDDGLVGDIWEKYKGGRDKS